MLKFKWQALMRKLLEIDYDFHRHFKIFDLQRTCELPFNKLNIFDLHITSSFFRLYKSQSEVVS